MENVTDALKMAFAVFIFIVGLGTAMHMFSLARQTSDFVVQTADETKYYSYENGGGSEYRIVGLETIIPTIYKYSKENYALKFVDSSGNDLKLYNSTKTGWQSTLDSDEEINRGETWQGNAEEVNSFIKSIIEGTEYEGRNLTTGGDFNGGLLKKISEGNIKFEEHIGKSYEALSGNKTTSKRYITYKKID